MFIFTHIYFYRCVCEFQRIRMSISVRGFMRKMCIYVCWFFISICLNMCCCGGPRTRLLTNRRKGKQNNNWFWRQRCEYQLCGVVIFKAVVVVISDITQSYWSFAWQDLKERSRMWKMHDGFHVRFWKGRKEEYGLDVSSRETPGALAGPCQVCVCIWIYI